MKKSLSLLFCAWLLTFSGHLFAQKNIVSVNTLTGTANVVIPVFEIDRGQVKLPISLVYAGTGVKPKDIESTAGMNWRLQAGGQISMQVRGLPDDVMKDNLGNARLGWMYNTNTTKINNFSIANDNNPSTCTDGTNDVNYIASNFSDNSDTEPDVFYVSAPGLSCELIFDQATQQFKTIGYKDLKITYSAYSSTATYAGQIIQFTITNDKGITYMFGSADQIRETTTTATGGTAVYFKNKYNLYQNGITYFNNWHLTYMGDNNGNSISLSYNPVAVRNSTDQVSLYMPGATTPTLQYKILQTVTPYLLSSAYGNYDVDNPVDVLTFNWFYNSQTNGGSGQTMITSITGAGRTFNFTYGSPYYNVPSTAYNYVREFLTNYSESGCASPVNYQFSYNGVDFNAGTTTLPDSTTKQVDYWGYYANNTNTSLMPKVWVATPSVSFPEYSVYLPGTSSALYPYYTTNGNTRAADTTNVMTGSLNKITYAEGGATTLTYESNDYVDYPSGTTVKGGGIRIKQITDDDGFGTGNTITRSYSYVNPAGGVTSGVPLSLPQYAFTVPYSGGNTGNALWNSATVVSDNDLSDEDHTIMYSYVRQKQTGAGSTLYHYYVPASYWNTSASPDCSGCSTADWAPTLDNVQRITCSSVTGPISNTLYNYPFIPNENYDFERGQLQSITNYNDAGTEVGETDYTYQRSYTPSTITALKWEDDPYSNNTAGVRSFAKYQINYNASELLSQEVKKVYDSGTLSTAQSSTVNYTYGSAYHKLVTQQQLVNSDNSTVTTYIKYVKDYNILSSNTNRNINALYNLQQLNINAPVETYRQVTRSGVTKTTSAGLTFFQDFTTGTITKYRPSIQYNFFNADGATDFAPASISGTTYNKYGGYYAAANFTGYNILGDLQTSDDAHQHVNGLVLDNISGKPAITVANAAASEIFFNDFDSEFQAPWTGGKAGPSSYTPPAGSHNGNDTGLGTGQTFTYTLNKNAIATNYIFSAWVNTSVAGTITFVTTPTTGTAVTSTQTLASSSGAWKYMEWKIPVSTMTSTFTIAISANINAGIDDIIFYPETASVTTYAYDPVTHFNTSVTNTNGVSVYYTDDTWGRPVYTLDQDHNIVKKNTYVTGSMAQNWNPTAVIAPTNVYKNIAAAFSAGGTYDQCDRAGAIVNWNFGDGGTASTALSSSPQHTYTTTGTFTVNGTVYSPVFGSKTLTPVSVTVQPTPVPVTVTNSTNYSQTAITVTFYSAATGITYTGNPGPGSMNIPPDTYLVNVYVTGGQLYNSSTGVGYSGVMLNGSCVVLCQDYTSNNRAQFTNVNISSCTSLNVLISKQTCSILTQ